MLTVTKDQVIEVIKSIGIHRGDGLLVHSALQYLGRPQRGIEIYLEALAEVLGIPLIQPDNPYPPGSGTFAVPAFNFGFARGKPYDPQTTPSVGMGTFSELVRGHLSARRTSHPMQSLAVIGKYADDLAERDTPSAFDPGSAFDRMMELKFKILLLGADIQAISALHYSEQQLQVPYRYWKDFTGQVLTPEGWVERTYRMFVRDLTVDPHIDLRPVQEVLEQRGQWHTRPLNYGWVSSCEMRHFVAAIDEFITDDPWSLVVNKPT